MKLLRSSLAVFLLVQLSLALLGVASGATIDNFSYTILPVDYYNICVVDGDTLYALDYVNSTATHVYESVDYGLTWTRCTEPSDESLVPISMFVTDNGTLLISLKKDYENGTIWRSTDGATTWTKVLTMSNHTYLHRCGMGFVESGTNILLGAYGDKELDYGKRRVYHSANNGVDWTIVFESYDYNETSTKSQHIHAVYIDEYSYDWFVTEGDTVWYLWKSVDEGDNWTSITSIGVKSITEIFADEDYIYYGLDTTPHGLYVQPRNNETYTAVKTAEMEYEVVWDVIGYGDEWIVFADDYANDICLVIAGETDDVDEWETVGYWESLGNDMLDQHFSGVDDKGYVYLNTYVSNLWRIKLSRMTGSGTGISSGTFTGLIGAMITIAVVGMLGGMLEFRRRRR